MSSSSLGRSETSTLRPTGFLASRALWRRRCVGAQLSRGKIATLKVNPQRCPIDPDSEVYGEEVRVLLHGKRRGVYRVLFTIGVTRSTC